MFDAPDYNLGMSALAVVEDPTPAWRLYTSDGFAGEIGGTGTVFGTAGHQEIYVLGMAGEIVFDATFNKGGDTIHIWGDAEVWSVAALGSNAVFTYAGISITIPVGKSGTNIVFGIGYDDDSRILRYDPTAQKFLLGEQEFTDESVPITEPVETTTPKQFPLAGHAKLYLPAGEANLTIGGNVSIAGTRGPDRLDLLRGGITLDATFNSGGDSLNLHFGGSSFTAKKAGSNVVLSNPYGSISIPIGTEGLYIGLGYTGGRLYYDRDAQVIAYQKTGSTEIIDETGITIYPDYT